MKTSRYLSVLLAILLAGLASTRPVRAASFTPDQDFHKDRAALDELQQSAFKFMWEGGDPDSGMAYEATWVWDVRPVAAGGTGFGIAAIVVAVDRGWITREQAVARLMKIATFLRDKSPRLELHGAFPHWMEGKTGKAWRFDSKDSGADIVETSLLMQGLLIARAYFNGPGVEEKLRGIITELWEGVDWNWFTNGKDNGLYWTWNAEYGFDEKLKILGFNECMITYVLAISSPTHPISRASYDYWTSGDKYGKQNIYGYEVEASQPGGGPLFLAHYSFIGLDPHRLADRFVPHGYFVRNVKQTLSNRAYCLQEAPAQDQFSDDFWGLTASQIKGGYAVNEPFRNSGTVAPTAALSSIPYTPQFSTQVLLNFANGLRRKIWGKFGPYDAINLRDNWVSDMYLAIDQLPMVCMAENYRSGLLWKLFMADADVRTGLGKAGLAAPEFSTGFPEAVVTVRKEDEKYVPDAYDIRRHPDTGLYAVPYWCVDPGKADFRIVNQDDQTVYTAQTTAVKGSNILAFPQFMPKDNKVLTLIMNADGGEYRLPIRPH